MKYIHQLEDWPDFQWDSGRLTSLLAEIRYRQGGLLGQMGLQGFRLHHLQEEANLNSSKYSKLVKCSQDTALRDIPDLLGKGILIQNPGGGRSTSYRLTDPDEI